MEFILKKECEQFDFFEFINSGNHRFFLVCPKFWQDLFFNLTLSLLTNQSTEVMIITNKMLQYIAIANKLSKIKISGPILFCEDMGGNRSVFHTMNGLKITLLSQKYIETSPTLKGNYLIDNAHATILFDDPKGMGLKTILTNNFINCAVGRSITFVPPGFQWSTCKDVLFTHGSYVAASSCTENTFCHLM